MCLFYGTEYKKEPGRILRRLLLELLKPGAHFHPGSDTEITQGGSADSQLHRGKLPPVGGAPELQRSEQGKDGEGCYRAEATNASGPLLIV